MWFALATPAAAQTWWNPDWPHRSRLVFDNAEGTEDVDDLIALVVLSDGTDGVHPQNYSFAAAPTPDALRFVDDDQQTELPFEVDAWNEGGIARLWVRVPKIDAASVTDRIWLYDGNVAVGAAADPGAAWAGWDAVFHLETLTDSAKGHTLSLWNGPEPVAGLIGQGYYFDPFDALVVSDPLDFDYGASFTVEASFFVPDFVTDYAAILTKGDASWRIHRNGNMDALTVDTTFGGLSFSTAGTVPVDDGLGHVVVATYDGADVTLYIDGQRYATRPETRTVDVDVDPVWIGNNQDKSDRGLSGRVDEVRLSSVARSASWVAADHRSLTDQLITYCTPWDGDADGDGSCFDEDCDEQDPAVHPGALEVPDNGLDDDCVDGDQLGSVPTTTSDRTGSTATTPGDDDDAAPADWFRGSRGAPTDTVGCGCAGTGPVGAPGLAGSALVLASWSRRRRVPWSSASEPPRAAVKHR